MKRIAIAKVKDADGKEKTVAIAVDTHQIHNGKALLAKYGLEIVKHELIYVDEIFYSNKD